MEGIKIQKKIIGFYNSLQFKINNINKPKRNYLLK